MHHVTVDVHLELLDVQGDRVEGEQRGDDDQRAADRRRQYEIVGGTVRHGGREM